jgi:hypothetical protein
MKRESRIALPVPLVESPLRHLPLVDLLVDTKSVGRTSPLSPRAVRAPRAAKWSSWSQDRDPASAWANGGR